MPETKNKEPERILRDIKRKMSILLLGVVVKFEFDSIFDALSLKCLKTCKFAIIYNVSFPNKIFNNVRNV